MFHFDGWSMKAVMVFVVVGGMVRASLVMTGSGLVFVSLEAVLTCIVKWGKCMRLCGVNDYTVIPKKCCPEINPVSFFITGKFLAIILSFNIKFKCGCC